MGSKGQQVDLMSLDVQQVSRSRSMLLRLKVRLTCAETLFASTSQLLEVKKQLETEVQHLTSSFGQLKAAQAKFKSCIESVATIKPENKDKTTLIPLTSSLYVPGKLSDVENVIVDVGTGYFVEKVSSPCRHWYLHTGSTDSKIPSLLVGLFTANGRRYQDVSRKGRVPHQKSRTAARDNRSTTRELTNHCRDDPYGRSDPN